MNENEIKQLFEEVKTNKKKDISDICIIYKCPMCNNEIDSYIYDMKHYAYRLVYRNKNYIFCSWGCKRKFENERVVRKRKPKNY